MRVTHITAGLLAFIIAAAPAFAQATPASEATGSYYVEPESVSTGRLIAGVREYPPRVLRSLLQLAEEPLVLRQLADEPGLLERPQDIKPPVSSALHDAIRELAAMPAVVSVAADHPEELEALRQVYAESPVETEQDIGQLRADYDYAEAAAAGAWQQVLEQNPAAFGEYQKLVTDFCKAQRQAYPGFPCVQVLAQEYYYACPPNEAIVLYAIENAESSAAMQAIDQWWRSYAPDEIDAQILGESDTPVDYVLRPEAVAAMPPEQRVSMWAPSAARDAGAAYLIPVIMQPPADMPPEARYARAIAGHARLWTPFSPPDAEEQPYAEISVEPEAREWITQPAKTSARPAVMVEDLGAWDGEGPSDDYAVEDWTYAEEPETRVVYVDDDRDYTPSAWDYAPSYTYVRHYTHHRYYEPLAVYYCGYTVDWPLFYWCEPSWLVGSSICSGYYGHGYRSSWHRYYYGNGGFSAYFDFGRGGHHHRDSGYYRDYRSVRVGNRSYYRFASDRISDVLRDYGSRRNSVYASSRHGSRRSWTSPRSGRRYDASAGSDGRRGSSYRSSHALSSRSAPSIVTSRRGDASSRGSRTSTGRTAGISPRSVVSSRRSGDLARTPGVSTRRSTGSAPRTATSPRRTGDTRGSSDVSSRRGSSRRPTDAVSPRSGNTPRSGVGASTRPRAVTTPKRAVSPSGNSAPRRIPAAAPRTRTSPEPRSGASPRSTSAPRRSSGVSSRTRPTNSPRSTASPRSTTAPRRTPAASPRSRTSSTPKRAISPRSSNSPRRGSGASSRSGSSTKSRSSVSPRPSSAPRRSSGVSSRPKSTSRPRSSVSSRRSGGSQRSSGGPRRHP